MNDMSKPKLTIIIPVYNAANHLERCLDSVFNQTVYDIQIIVVNDGSTDGSQVILDRYIQVEPRLRIIVQENRGLVLSRKAGLQYASSDYIYHLDADDYIEPTLVEEVLLKIEETDADMLLFNFEICRDEKCIPSRPYEQSNFTNIEFLKSIWLGRGYYALWSHVHKRSLYDEIRFYDNISLGEDALMTSQLAYSSKNIVFLNSAPLLHYYIYRESMSNSKLDAKKANDILLYPEMIDELMKNKPEYHQLVKYIWGLKLISNNILLSRCWFDGATERSKESVAILKRYPDLQIYNSIRNMRKLFILFARNYYLGFIFAQYYRLKGKISPYPNH